MVSFIHDRMKFYFVHVPKTGGMSVAHFFFPDGQLRTGRLDLSLKNDALGIHDGVQKILPLLGETWSDYFSFAFYRNSWDWSFSLYRYIRATPSHPRHLQVRDLSFEDYVDQVAADFYRPQAPMVALDGRCVVKRLEDYRDFPVRFPEILTDLGFEDVQVERRNAAPVSVDYRSVYTPRMAARIGEIYEEDIAFFNFRF